MKRKVLTTCSAIMLLSALAVPVVAQNSSINRMTVQAIQPRYTEIRDTSFGISTNQVKASLHSWETCQLSISLYIYQNGLLVKHFSASNYGKEVVIDKSYTLSRGTYDVKCTFKAGSEEITREKTFNL